MKKIIENGKHFKIKFYENPKKAFRYAMTVLAVSFCLSLVKEVFFPTKIEHSIFPELFSASDRYKKSWDKNTERRQEELRRIVAELKTFQEKTLQGKLSSEDSIRMKFLITRYNQWKNEYP